MFAETATEKNSSLNWIYGLFTLSGFAGLLYEVIFAKRLGITFGGTALAAYTVMATYMGGMALGAWLGGVIADRVRVPLGWYAAFEAAIGLYALATPGLFALTNRLYVYLAADVRPDAPLLTFLRVLLGVLVLGIPTVLMGTTLPLMFKFLRSAKVVRGQAIAGLYTANIIGAALGALLGGYLVLPALGIFYATVLSASIGFMIALYVIYHLKINRVFVRVAKGLYRKLQVICLSFLRTMDKKVGWLAILCGILIFHLLFFDIIDFIVVVFNTVYAFSLTLIAALFVFYVLRRVIGYIGVDSSQWDDYRQSEGSSAAVGISALLVVTIGGMVSLALETVNMHLLAVVAGNSVYAFALMLSTFLFGLGLGSFVYARLQEKLSDYWLIIIAQSGIFFSIVVCAYQWNFLAEYFSRFAVLPIADLGFAARELIRGLVCAIIMIPAAFFIGLGYPAAMNLASAWLQSRKEATGVGLASLCNTLGNIAGVLLAGFFLLDVLGSNRLLLLLALVSLLLAFLMFMADYRTGFARIYAEGLWGGRFLLGYVLLLLLAIPLYPRQWDLHTLTLGANVYFRPMDRGEVIAARESVSGGMTTVHRTRNIFTSEPMLTLQTNGKFQGNNTGEVTAQRSIALIPLLHLAKRESALVIGYGTGMSAHNLQPLFQRLDIAELSKDIVELADAYFSDVNGEVSGQENVKMYYTDGRNFLLTHHKDYDLISMEISSIWFAGAANLYNREFYQIAKKRLRKGGVLQQWVQLHHMRFVDLLHVLHTIHGEFRYVWLYFSGGQGVLVASDYEDSLRLHNIFGQPIKDTGQLSEEEKKLLISLLFDSEDFDYLAHDAKSAKKYVSTDDNLYLEYATPKGNALEGTGVSNVNSLKSIREERLQLKALR